MTKMTKNYRRYAKVHFCAKRYTSKPSPVQFSSRSDTKWSSMPGAAKKPGVGHPYESRRAQSNQPSVIIAKNLCEFGVFRFQKLLGFIGNSVDFCLELDWVVPEVDQVVETRLRVPVARRGWEQKPNNKQLRGTPFFQRELQIVRYLHR